MEKPYHHCYTCTPCEETQEFYCPECLHCQEIHHFNGKFYYSNVCDSHVNNSDALHINKALESIAKGMAQHKNYSGDIKISFAYGYLRDSGIEELANFICQDPRIRSQLVKLNLKGNQFTSGSFQNIQKILSHCPKVHINMWAAYFTMEEFDREFTHVKDRVEFSVY